MDDFDAWLAHGKSLWARVYDEVILPDVNKEWKKRSDAHGTQLKNKDEELRMLRDHVSNGVAKNARLTYENTQLQSLIEKHGIEVPKEGLDGSAQVAQIPANEFNDVVSQLQDLNKRHQDAMKRLKYLERKNDAIMQKNKDMKDSVKAWQDYAERHLERKRLKSEGRASTEQRRSNVELQTPGPVPFLPSSPASAAVQTPRSLAPQQRSSPIPLIEAETEVNLPRDGQEEQDGLVVDRRHILPRMPSGDDQIGFSIVKSAGPSNPGQFTAGRIDSSQTTVPEAIDQENQATSHERNLLTTDDEPEFLYGRSLKRKRHLSTSVNVFRSESDGTPAKPVRVKEEIYSSPPSDSAVNASLRKETFDLDELGPNPIMTPRHQRRKRLNSIYSVEPRTLRKQRSNSVPSSDNLVKAEPTEETNMIEVEDTRAVSEPTGAILKPREILQTLNPNIVPRKADTPNKRVKTEKARHESRFGILTESGETAPFDSRIQKRLPPNLARAHFNERIRATKSGSSSAKNVIKTPKSAPAKSSTAQVSKETSSHHTALTPSAKPSTRRAPATIPRPEVIPDDRPIWRMSAFEPSRKAPIPPAPRTEQPQGRLRDKPLTELGIQDFKINPVYNGGHTYAFTDTIRRREDRLCLPGCTNPSCCGSTFRSLALAAARLSASQEEELLADYLGDAYDSFGLTQMSREEREEIVIQARTRKLATEHGKHRRLYEGRKTPPGFWRVDFPTTQEEAEDREKAAQMELEEIKSRWLEAMRKGGKYMFADE